MSLIKLTPAEARYVMLLSKGLTADEICQQTNWKRSTMQFNAHQARKKLGVKTGDQQLVQLLNKHKFLQPTGEFTNEL